MVAGVSRLNTNANGTIVVDPETLLTNRPGVFAGGDVVTGPNTIVDAIAAGKKAAVVIERYLKSEMLKQPHVPRLPKVYVEPPPAEAGTEEPAARADTPRAPVEWRRRGFAEVEMSLSAEESRREALRCLRCDLEFTKPSPAPEPQTARESEVGVA